VGKCGKPSSFNFRIGTGGKNCARTVANQGITTKKGEIDASKRRITYQRDTVQITTQGSDNFIITLDMLFIDEETT
jgi:hypothetical protein